MNQWYLQYELLCSTDLLLKLGDPNSNLRLLRIYGNSIERKDHVGPYHNKEVIFIHITAQVQCRLMK